MSTLNNNPITNTAHPPEYIVGDPRLNAQLDVFIHNANVDHHRAEVAYARRLHGAAWEQEWHDRLHNQQKEIHIK